MRLDAQLDSTAKEVATLEGRLANFWMDKDADFLRQKWLETLSQWQRAQKEAESMREELVEDK